MHLLAAWKALGTLDLLRLLGIPAAILCATLLPGRVAARVAALVAAAGSALLVELAAPWPVRAGWPAAWLLVAWFAGVRDAEGGPATARRRGAFESGMVALPLGGGLLILLLATASRQALPADGARVASLGALVLGAGLLHLLLRRHVRRATVAFASLGLGLELLAAAARGADPLRAGPPPGVALAAALVALGLVARVALSRERHAGSPLVSDAHELHD